MSSPSQSRTFSGIFSRLSTARCTFSPMPQRSVQNPWTTPVATTAPSAISVVKYRRMSDFSRVKSMKALSGVSQKRVSQKRRSTWSGRRCRVPGGRRGDEDVFRIGAVDDRAEDADAQAGQPLLGRVYLRRLAD